MKHKKYIIFAYDCYYPSGGMNDIDGSFDNYDEAREFAIKMSAENVMIVNRDTWKEETIRRNYTFQRMSKQA